MSREGQEREHSAFTGREELAVGQPRRVLICAAEDFCAEARRELQRRKIHLGVAAVQELAGARQSAKEETPAVILAEERALVDGAGSLPERRQELAAALALLAGYAPVVWIGGVEDAREISPALDSAPVDFVPRSALCLPAAINMVERRLRSVSAAAGAGVPQRRAFSFGEPPFESRDFGEVLRHELNNPLTGILGNAELVLLEVRRGKLELPPHTLQRLEVITELAVRMRETVRQLSDRWEARGGNPSAENEMPAEQPGWPVSG